MHKIPCIWILNPRRILSQLIKRLIQVSHPYRLRFSPYVLIPAGYQPLSPLPSGRERISKMLKSGLKIIFQILIKKVSFFKSERMIIYFDSVFEIRIILSPKAVSIIIYLVQDPYFVFVDDEIHYFHSQLFHQNHPFSYL